MWLTPHSYELHELVELCADALALSLTVDGAIHQLLFADTYSPKLKVRNAMREVRVSGCGGLEDLAAAPPPVRGLMSLSAICPEARSVSLTVSD